VTDELTEPDTAYGLALPDYAEEVLDVVDAIPEGQVMTYGDIAELVGRGGPRQVGSVMSHYGSATNWWRVIRADGRPPACHEGEAHRHYREEGTPLRGERVDLRRARWEGPVRHDAGEGA
jgi:alkylated DNA nucleotide flippase Atl1